MRSATFGETDYPISHGGGFFFVSLYSRACRVGWRKLKIYDKLIIIYFKTMNIPHILRPRWIPMLILASTLFPVSLCFGQHLADVNRFRSAKRKEKIDIAKLQMAKLDSMYAELNSIDPKKPYATERIRSLSLETRELLSSANSNRSVMNSYATMDEDLNNTMTESSSDSKIEKLSKVNNELSNALIAYIAANPPPKTSAADDSSLTLQGIGSVLTGLGVETSPTISATGSYKDTTLHLYSEVQILKGTAPADTFVNIAKRLFVPEASNVAVELNTCYAICPHFGVNLNLSAGSKNVFQNDTQTSGKTSSIIMSQIGVLLEYGIDSNQLTVYGGCLYTSPIVGRVAYQTYFANNTSVNFWNLNFGVRAILGRKFELNLGLILLNALDNRSNGLFIQTSSAGVKTTVSNDPLILALKLSVPQDLLSGS